VILFKFAMPQPSEYIDGIEQGAKLPKGSWERFSGYGIMGLPFSSGHILGLRCFPASSLGKPYRSVWHRDPDGKWAFYQDVQADLSCPRYFSHDLYQYKKVDEIKVDWTGGYELVVSILGDISLEWKVSLTSTLSSRFMNAIAGLIPSSLWHNPGFLDVMGMAASLMLGAGKLGLSGIVPNGQQFVANPKHIWMIRNSEAILQGRSLGAPGRLDKQAQLGDFWIPQRGILAIGESLFEPYDPSRHSLKIN
jgi:hypothetical protein